jgi:hypothetical protein
MERAGRETG